ncbi:MAG: adenosylcobinamide-phosphate synthase CbiB [Corynebacterium sp.]|nr:adenosylcobinamide-phosphate synthase CbiB [Corynebacterium sp.]
MRSFPRSILRTRAFAILGGLAADALFRDPQTHHPVAYFGRYVSAVEAKLYKPSKARGAAFFLATVAPPVLLTQFFNRKYPTATLMIALWASLGGHTLCRIGRNVSQDLAVGDVDAARTWIPWLCSRDPQFLDEPGIIRATIESLAENTCDAASAPLFWAAVAGAPGVIAHRAVNTLDAMVGYKNERYKDFGFVSAKADDVMAFLPARLTALSHMLLHPRRAGVAWKAWRTQAPKHPSPNAGPVEATAAAALNISLGGPTQYAHGIEDRPRMGFGPAPEQKDIEAAGAQARSSMWLLATGLAGALLLISSR